MKRKAQLVITDLLFVVIILIILFTVSIAMWNTSMIRIAQREEVRNLESAAIAISDLLVKTKGVPENWEESAPTTIGLADSSNVLNIKKLTEFLDLNYNDAKRLFGGYDFYFRLSCLDNYTARINGLNACSQPIAYIAQQYPADVGIMYMLNNSGMVWDFYWGGGSLPVPPGSLTARYIYAVSGSKTAYRWMIANISNYNSVVSEDTHVHDTDLTSSERVALRNFVSSGKTYLHIQHELDLLNIFGLNSEGSNRNQGTVVNLDDVLHDVTIGSDVAFQQGTETFDIAASPLPLKVLMRATSDSSNCIFCRWTYGNGRIYYMPDANSSATAYVPGFDVVGRKIENGTTSANARNIVNSRRIVLLDNQPVFLDLMVWK